MNIYKKLQNKCDRLEAELEESRRNVRAYSDAQRNTNRYVGKLQAENAELTERLESWQLSHKRLEDDYRELSAKARHVTFTDELEEFTTNHTFFTKLKPDRIASLIDDIKSQNEPLEQAKDMVEALKDELEDTVSELASVKAENERLSKLLAMYRMGFTTNG